MFVSISAQGIGRRKTAVQPVQMELKSSPDTLRDLIRLCVEACVERQHKRLAAPEETVLASEEIDGLSLTGKIAFGVDYNRTPVQSGKAVENALRSFADGLYRVFLNGREIKGLDTALSLTENDTLTFIRLTMLAGAPWQGGCE